MNFWLTEEQEQLAEVVRAFAEAESPPDVTRAAFDEGDGGSEKTWRALVEVGVPGMLIPEEYGGTGLGLLELAIAASELGRVAMPGPFLGHALAAIAIVEGGSDAQKARWLPGLASGDTLATVALEEPGGGWSPDGWETIVDGGRVRGSKVHVPMGSRADLVVTGTKGGALVLLEAKASGASFVAHDALDRGRPMAALELEEVEGDVLPHGRAARVLDAGRVLLAADAFGAGSQLLSQCVAHAESREQFGRPISGFQAVKHQIADMALRVEPNRGLWWYAAHAYDERPAESERAAALAKAHITDECMRLARSAVQIHGGYGFTWECDVQIWFKRLLFDRMFLGAPDLLRECVASRGDW